MSPKTAANDLDQLVGQDADEQVTVGPDLLAVIHGTQTQFRLERTEHRFHIRQHGIGPPQGLRIPVDSWTVVNDRSGDRITWLPDPPDRAPGHGVTLDYCFVTPDLAHKVKRAWVDEAADGSDHRPYWVELDL